MASVSLNELMATFTYDGEGNRIRKVGKNGTVDYIVIGGTIYGEIRTVNGTTTTLHYLFDETGTRIGFVVDGEATYYYRFNLQGDVTGIFNASGTLITEYFYDAWGKLENTTGNYFIGLLNPIRYRGYYFDMETGLYFLQTRYYDPETGRFINADSFISTGQGILSCNMFAYCGNNPVNRADPSGQIFEEVFQKVMIAIGKTLCSVFGAESTKKATLKEVKTPIIPDPSPITAEIGSRTTHTVSKHGDSSKPISVYANKDAKNPIKSSSVGLNLNIGDYTLNLNIGFDDIGIYVSFTDDNKTNKSGIKLNLSELKIGIESSSTLQLDDTVEENYVNVSVNGWAIAAVYLFVTTGQIVPSPSYSY